MHARIDQLLSIRDAEPMDASIAAHVSACARCATELRRLEHQREALQRLPQYSAPDLWSRIEHAARARRSRPRWAVVAAMLMLGIIASIAYRHVPNDFVYAPNEEARHERVAASRTADQRMSALLVRSHELERVLQSLPRRPALERAGTAATIDGLEERIQWLDHHLNHADDAGLDETQTAHLWQERVSLLDTLVKVRYAESGAYSF